jgi:hypothetical protein
MREAPNLTRGLEQAFTALYNICIRPILDGRTAKPGIQPEIAVISDRFALSFERSVPNRRIELRSKQR